MKFQAKSEIQVKAIFLPFETKMADLQKWAEENLSGLEDERFTAVVDYDHAAVKVIREFLVDGAWHGQFQILRRGDYLFVLPSGRMQTMHREPFEELFGKVTR